MSKTKRLSLTGFFVALAIILPFITGQIPEFGAMLTPMHFPVILGSLFVGPIYGLMIGIISPILRQMMFGMPPFPMNVMMAIELGVYGLLTGFLFKSFKKVIKRDIFAIYIALIIAMIFGRIAFALSKMFIIGIPNFMVVFIETFTGSFFGIILQFILIPLLFLRVKKGLN